MDLFELAAFDRHEKVLFCNEARTGLRAIIAVHSTQLGPATQEVAQAIGRIYATVLEIFARAEAEGTLPESIALRVAQERLSGPHG